MLGRFIHYRVDTLRACHHKRNNFAGLASRGKHIVTAALDPLRSPCFLATSERATSALSVVLASKRQAGDCICLRGEVGAGKSAFRQDLPPQKPSQPCKLPFQAEMADRTCKDGQLQRLNVMCICSRAYIRAVEEDDTVPIPSPTYLLQNIYEYTDGERPAT